MPLWSWLLAAVPLAWLVPNHYFPWLSAWQDGLALALLFLAAVCLRRRIAVPWPWMLAAGLAGLSVMLQWATGRVVYGGDALMVGIYLAAWVASLGLGHGVATEARSGALSALEAVALGTLACAALSVGIALLQWTGAWSLGIYGAEMAPGGRPFGNTAQPNHLCTLLFLGLCSLGLLWESERVGTPTFLAAGSFLIAGMVMSASRTGWLQVAALVSMLTLLAARVPGRPRVGAVLVLALFYVAFTLVWPGINDALMLAGGRGVGEQIQGGVRGPLWWALLDAIHRQPLWGYGWQQMVMAQQAVALDHPAILRHFDHSHNLVLDLLIWAGVPVGGSILALAAWALWRQFRAVRDGRAVWLMTGVTGVLLHALLEFPLEYAYFLIPVGVALGAAHGLSPAGPMLKIGMWTLPACALLLATLLFFIARDYVVAEQNLRVLRLERARIGTERVESRPPGLALLTQLEGLLEAGRIEPRPGMPAAEIEIVHRSAQRYAYMQSMFRSALADGLNGHLPAARDTLARLCRMHTPPECAQAQAAWQIERQRHPELGSAEP